MKKTISLKYFNSEIKKLEKNFSLIENPSKEQIMEYLKVQVRLAMALT
jgi:hypothetical protein